MPEMPDSKYVVYEGDSTGSTLENGREYVIIGWNPDSVILRDVATEERFTPFKEEWNAYMDMGLLRPV